MKKILRYVGLGLLILLVVLSGIMVLFGDRIPYLADFILIQRLITP